MGHLDEKEAVISERGEFLKKLIIRAGELALEYFRTEVRSRTKRHAADIVTEADEAVSEFLIEQIRQTYPSHGIHSEELADDVNPGSGVQWMIDPIDGTRMFALGIPMWCVMVAAIEGGEITQAGIYHPVLRELFFAEKGEGAYLNGERIRAGESCAFDFCLGVVGYDGSYGVKVDRYVTFVNRFLTETTGWLHNFGTMYTSCLLACGKADFVTVNCGFDHDYVAPALILREAGAKVTNLSGEEWTLGMRDFVAAGPKLHQKVLDLFKGK